MTPKPKDIMRRIPVCPETEEVGIDLASSRVVSRDYYAKFPMPAFDKSPFDGYAFKGKDTPGTVKVVGSVFAGDTMVPDISDGEALHVFTGAPVPESADCTIKFEKTKTEGEFVFIPETKPGTNIIKTGEEYPDGTKITEKGSKLTPAALGMLASQGYDRAEVYKKPKIALIATGTELVLPGNPLRDYCIYNSSSPIIKAMLENIGTEVDCFGPVPDVQEKISENIINAVKNYDMVITTGGASVGDKDFALATAADNGGNILFWKLNMKPGGATLVSVINGKVVLSLSGNPAASVMSLILVAQPYLRKLCGQERVDWKYTKMHLKDDFCKTSTAWRMLRGHMVIEDGTAMFEENPGRGNGNISSYRNCTVIGLVPPTENFLKRGSIIDTYVIDSDILP